MLDRSESLIVVQRNPNMINFEHFFTSQLFEISYEIGQTQRKSCIPIIKDQNIFEQYDLTNTLLKNSLNL